MVEVFVLRELLPSDLPPNASFYLNRVEQEQLAPWSSVVHHHSVEEQVGKSALDVQTLCGMLCGRFSMFQNKA